MTFKNTLYKQFLNTAENAGLKIISDEKCCQLLAWVYHIGGYTEESTHNVKLRESIFTAQKRLNILGGEIPNQELVEILKEYTHQLKAFIDGKIEKPLWLDELEKHYKIRPYKKQTKP